MKFALILVITIAAVSAAYSQDKSTPLDLPFDIQLGKTNISKVKNHLGECNELFAASDDCREIQIRNTSMMLGVSRKGTIRTFHIGGKCSERTEFPPGWESFGFEDATNLREAQALMQRLMNTVKAKNRKPSVKKIMGDKWVGTKHIVTKYFDYTVSFVSGSNKYEFRFFGSEPVKDVKNEGVFSFCGATVR